jgi:four helix bundle protein
VAFADEIETRLKEWSLAVIRFCRTLPASDEARYLGEQLRRAASSSAANYRACRRSRSRSEWIAKLGVVVEELDESDHWFTVMTESAVAAPPQNLIVECRSLRAILAKARATARHSRGLAAARPRNR